MLRPRTLRAILPRSTPRISPFSTTPPIFSDQPNQPIDLDPSYRALLRDVDISLVKHKSKTNPNQPVGLPSRDPPRELEEFPVELTPDEMKAAELLVKEQMDKDEEAYGGEEYHAGKREDRKSPAALFGSQAIGQVVLPYELQTSVGLMIQEADKTMLHSDAKRLFSSDKPGAEKTDAQETWDTSYDLKKYRSLKQAGRHAVRDGTAFASIALPSHYAAIYAVMEHLKRRLEPSWKVEKVIDWGAGTGSGLWASMHAFQKQANAEKGFSPEDPKIANSHIVSYTGIEKREGLVTIAKRLLRNVDRGSLSATWQKSWQEDDKMNRTQGKDTIALSAFMLSALPTDQARKVLVKEMWESGAEMIVLIDHSSTAGFESIAKAREYLLNVGRKEFGDPETDEWDIRGSHVIAPCPHDGACPLYHPGSSRLVCSFSQRLQRPAFVRLTKHSGVGHEDSRYSYVVIRRGARPTAKIGESVVGRVGAVGKEALEKEAMKNLPIKELMLHGEHEELEAAAEVDGTHEPELGVESTGSSTVLDATQSAEELKEALRLEAYGWPRLVFPPLKRSGHVILDSCTAEGKVMRITIPKSQGKQQYYDARKASWGDMFPHPPKNKPQERYQPAGLKNPVKGGDIGKRGGKKERAVKTSYASLADDIKDKKKKQRKERLRAAEDYDVDN